MRFGISSASITTFCWRISSRLRMWWWMMTASERQQREDAAQRMLTRAARLELDARKTILPAEGLRLRGRALQARGSRVGVAGGHDGGEVTRPLISATLIAKNEAHNVKRCLDSLWPWVDEICVADTGSTDDTIAEFKQYADDHGYEKPLKIVQTDACNDENGLINDFAAARQAADDLAKGEWVVWCDMDDEVRGMETLRQMAANASESVVAFFLRYRYASDEDGNSISELWRERVVRNNGTKWQGRLHEHKIFMGAGEIVQVDPSMAEWIHHRDHTQRTGERNLRILEDWLKDDPDGRAGDSVDRDGIHGDGKT